MPREWDVLKQGNEPAWRELVARYANGRQLCNCRCAYYDETGVCKYGCQANQYLTKELIARQVLEELPPPKETPNG